MYFARGPVRSLILGFCLVLPLLAAAAPRQFDLPAQSTAEALLAFSRQTEIEVLFPYDDLAKTSSAAVQGAFEPEVALLRILDGTGFALRRNRNNKFIITAPPTNFGSLRGRLLLAGGEPAANITVQFGPRRATTTDAAGNFEFAAVPAGNWQLLVAAPGYRPVKLVGLRVDPNRTLTLAPQRLLPAGELTVLEPYVVNAESSSLRTAREAALVSRRAAGNLDLPRTGEDALPYTIYTRDQIARSGVVNLNQFLQRELLDSDAAAGTAESSTSSSLVATGSSNLRLRGFEADETIVFVNGRRLPETLREETGSLASPDVNLVPLGLIEQVEVLPVSAAALYGGNAVGGIINIVLRPDINATEVTTTYTNTLDHYDAPESSVSLLHGHTLLDGRLRLRLNAAFSRTLPPTENELGLLQRRTDVDAAAESLFRATPNIRSADGGPLLTSGGSSFTSVAPGANGHGGLAAFAGRDGVRSIALYDVPGGMASSPVSLDYGYGRRQARETWFGSVNYDVRPWLQLGCDLAYSHATINRGVNVFSQELSLPAAAAFNPFGRDVVVSLNENSLGLGSDYSEARQEALTAILGVLVKLPADWHVALDTQYTRNTTLYRGFAGVDAGAWQGLVDTGRYNPLRDTQAHPAPAAFYDEVLIYRGTRGQFITMSDYDVIDAAMRVTNQDLPLPTGRGTLNAGVDYRRNRLAPFTDDQRYGHGGFVGPPQAWSGRTLQRYSGFAEIQGPLMSSSRLPAWLHGLEADLAVRYIASDKANEAYVAPTLALKADFRGGLAFRASFTTSSRFPTPRMSSPIALPGGGGSGSEGTFVFDPVRNETYVVSTSEPVDPGVRTEDAATQTAGLQFQRGKTRRVRLALDYVDTRKTDELFYLSAQGAVNSESLFPGRVQRGTNGRILSVRSGVINAAWRHSQNWNFSADYAQDGVFGGTLELYGRWVYFQSYDRQLLANSPVVDQLDRPDGSTPSVLRHRANLGAGWSRRRAGFGLDGHFFGTRTLPMFEWASQGSSRIPESWQFDAYLQGDLQRLLPWRGKRAGLRGQLRVNNVFAAAFPRYANDASGAGVQPYGDWRGRTYSLSLTATF